MPFNCDRRLNWYRKKALYQNTFRTPDYFWFDPNTLEFQGFTLLRGQYQPITPSEQGCLWSEQLGLYLGVLEGKLRYFTSQGELVPTPQEVALQERLSKEQEKIAKQVAQQRSEKLAQKLRSLGINPDEI